MARAALENTTITSYKKRVDTHARFGDDDEIARTAAATAVIVAELSRRQLHFRTRIHVPLVFTVL
jgi:hypothetical protein